MNLRRQYFFAARDWYPRAVYDEGLRCAIAHQRGGRDTRTAVSYALRLCRLLKENPQFLPEPRFARTGIRITPCDRFQPQPKR